MPKHCATQALALVRTARDDDVQALCLQVLGVCALRLGRLAEAKRHFERAQQHALAASSPRKAAAMLHNLAVVERAMGHTDEAIVLFLDAHCPAQAYWATWLARRAASPIWRWRTGARGSSNPRSPTRRQASQSAIAMASSKRGCRSSPT